jgi:hypothetical protein
VGGRAAVRFGFSVGIGRASGFDRQGGQGEFEFSQSNHGGLVFIKQAPILEAHFGPCPEARPSRHHAGKNPSTDK